jgi:hypothetical protein
MQWAIRLNAGIFGLSECIHSGAVLTQMSAFGAAAKHLLQISHTHDHVRAISFPPQIRQVIFPCNNFPEIMSPPTDPPRVTVPQLRLWVLHLREQRAMLKRRVTSHNRVFLRVLIGLD